MSSNPLPVTPKSQSEKVQAGIPCLGHTDPGQAPSDGARGPLTRLMSNIPNCWETNERLTFSLSLSLSSSEKQHHLKMSLHAEIRELAQRTERLVMMRPQGRMALGVGTDATRRPWRPTSHPQAGGPAPETAPRPPGRPGTRCRGGVAAASR